MKMSISKLFLIQCYAAMFFMVCLLRVNGQGNTSSSKVKIPTPAFNEGVIHSKTSFPGHTSDEAYKKVDFESGDFNDQHNIIKDLKKHQQSLKQTNEQEIKDAFFASAITLLPAYSKMHFTPNNIKVETYALGYRQQTLFNKTEKVGKMVLQDKERNNPVTINFNIEDLLEVWQKYQVNAEQYNIQKTTETIVIAGYTCKKIVYTFNGTSRGMPVTNYIINLQPVKVTVWYTDELPASINIMHPHFFEIDKAVLKYEVEYDNNKKNKMLVEVTSLQSQKIEEENLELKNVIPVIEHTKGSYDSGMRIMQVMMSAIGLLTK
jgi:GLPGLI family protein